VPGDSALAVQHGPHDVQPRRRRHRSQGWVASCFSGLSHDPKQHIRIEHSCSFLLWLAKCSSCKCGIRSRFPTETKQCSMHDRSTHKQTEMR